MLLLLLAAFTLGYCAARCSEEGRRCETWRDGVRFGATWREDLEEPKSYTEAGQGDDRLWEVNAEPGLPVYRLDPSNGEWIHADTAHESYTVTGTDGDPDYRELPH
jgi:hypothetical protein